MQSFSFRLALMCGALACGPAAAADQAAATAPPAATAPATAEGVPAPPPRTIPAGTVVLVEITQPLSSRTVHSGDHFTLRLAEPIVVDGVTLAPAGTTGSGEVIDAKAAGIGGRPGRLVLAARYLDVGAQRLTLQSLKLGGGGRDNSGVAVGATIAVGLVGALVPGGNLEYPAGTRATAKVAADLTVVAETPTAAPAATTTESIAKP